MYIDEIKKIIGTLVTKIDEYDNLEDTYNDRVLASKDRQITNRILSIAKYSIVPLIAIITLACKSVAIMGNPVFSPITIFGLIAGMGVSAFGFGSLIKKFVDSYRKKKYGEMTWECESGDWQEEEIINKIKMECVTSKRDALKKILSIFEKKVASLEEVSREYDISSKNKTLNKNEITGTIQKLTEELQRKFEELDKLSTLKVLDREFYKERSVSWKKVDTLGNGFITGLFGAIGALVMVLPFKGQGIGPLGLIAKGFLSGAGVSLIQANVSNKKRTKLFQKFNEKLGKDALSLFDIDSPRIEFYDDTILLKIGEIQSLSVELQEAHSHLNGIVTLEKVRDEEYSRRNPLSVDDNLECVESELEQSIREIDERKTFTIRPTYSKHD